MLTDGRTTKRKTVVLVVVIAILALVIATAVLLREHAPGNMGTGFLVGAAAGLVGAAAFACRVIKRPERATTFERAWTQTGDERDDAVLTQSLAMLGLLAVPLTGAATIAIGLGAAVEMMLALLLLAEVAVGATTFAVINRRS
jgi:drug/metabolite transporter (DMT)-like permease